MWPHIVGHRTGSSRTSQGRYSPRAVDLADLEYGEHSPISPDQTDLSQ